MKPFYVPYISLRKISLFALTGRLAYDCMCRDLLRKYVLNGVSVTWKFTLG